MEVKKNLNTVQRKMLDEIYTKQFNVREEAINKEREIERQKLEAKVLKDFKKDKDVKKYLEAGKAFYDLRKKLDSKLQENGIGVTEYVSNVPDLKLSYGYSNNYQQVPELLEFNDESYRIKQTLTDRKLEMRAKIYGLNASYEEVEADIKALFKDL
jgi:hypothetical protein